MSIGYDENDATRICEITIGGKATEADFERIGPQIRAFADRHDTIKVLEKIVKFEGAELGVLGKGLGLDLSLLPKVSHVAVVGEASWIKAVTKATGAVIPAETRYFSITEEEEARQWLAAA